MKAILFDIDGTLLNTHGIGGRAFHKALCEIFGNNIPPIEDWVGRTDKEVVYQVLTKLGVEKSKISRLSKRIFESYCKHLEQFARLYSDQFEVLSGVVELLEELKEKFISLTTGNLLPAAFIKLNTAGIGHYFAYGVGGFGNDHIERSQLVQIAIRRMKQYYQTNGFEQVIVIGDSHLDIQAAKKNQAVSLIVATGQMSIEQLAAYDPDYLFENLSDLNKLLSVLA